MVKIIWTKIALGDLEEVLEYIAQDSPYYAAILGHKILSLIEQLSEFPDTGRIVPEYQEKTLREKFFQNYRIVYRRKKYVIEIIAIVHSARLLKDIL